MLYRYPPKSNCFIKNQIQINLSVNHLTSSFQHKKRTTMRVQRQWFWTPRESYSTPHSFVTRSMPTPICPAPISNLRNDVLSDWRFQLSNLAILPRSSNICTSAAHRPTSNRGPPKPPSHHAFSPAVPRKQLYCIHSLEFPADSRIPAVKNSIVL